MTGRLVALAVLFAAVAGRPVLAQTTVNGSAEWTVASNASDTAQQSSESHAVWQNYALGYTSSLWDPRLVRFNTEGLFRTSRLGASGSAQPSQRGRQGDLGYRVGTSLFSASAFPLVFQASRTVSTSAGDLGPSNPVRSGMIAPTGTPAVDFESLNRSLGVAWQLGIAGLPRVELGYRRGSSDVTGGGYRADQRDSDLSAAVLKDTTRTRQSLRVQRTSFENVTTQTFAQSLRNLDYDFSGLVTPHTRVSAHGGRRTSVSRSVFAPLPEDTRPYVLPASAGASGAEYATAGVDIDPNRRFSLRLNGSAERQIGGTSTISAALATASSHVEPVRGVVLTASGTAGVRGQVIDNAPVSVGVRNGVAGATYQATVHWLTATVGGARGVGTSVTADGRASSTSSWSQDAGLSATFGWFGLGGGFDRAANRDGLLDYGNYASERARASVQAQGARAQVSLTGDQLRIDRGVFATRTSNVQRTVSASASVRLWRHSLFNAMAGGFVNDYASALDAGRDRTWFWSGSGQMSLRSSLRASAWVRDEEAVATRTGFRQRSLSGLARLEYRLRTLTLAAEYRRGRSFMQYVRSPEPDVFRGRQFRFTLMRQFGGRPR